MFWAPRILELTTALSEKLELAAAAEAAQSLGDARRPQPPTSAAATVKCGGKGSAFDKPGPDSPFKEAARRVARAKRAMALAAGGDLLSQVEALLDEHQSIEWRERAKGQVARFVEAAKRGVKPDDVQFDCTKCTASGHSHHFMCRQNKKQKDRDTQVKNKVQSRLHRQR